MNPKTAFAAENTESTDRYRAARPVTRERASFLMPFVDFVAPKRFCPCFPCFPWPVLGFVGSVAKKMLSVSSVAATGRSG